MTPWTLISWLAVTLTTIQFIPQVIRAYRTRSLIGVSLPSFILVMCSSTAWVVHGLHSHDLPIVVTNILVFICATAVVIRKLYVRQTSVETPGKPITQ